MSNAEQTQGVPAGPWEGAEEWMPLAWELCANECGEEACTELVWEGGPIPEPWGDRWLKYEGQAKEMIAMVRKSLLSAAPQAQHDNAIFERGFQAGRAHERQVMAAPQAQPVAGVQAPAPVSADVDELLRRFERQAQRFGELWERCQGKGWPEAESNEFTKIRDERLPALKQQIRAAAQSPATAQAQPVREPMSLDDVPAQPMGDANA